MFIKIKIIFKNICMARKQESQNMKLCKSNKEAKIYFYLEEN